MKKLLAALLMFTLLFGCALAERHPQDPTPITLHDVRAAFFDEAGNYTPALNVDGLTYVPVAAFSKAAGVNVQLDGKIITLNNVPLGLFDDQGNYLPPVEEAGILYVPLLPFCKAAALTAQVSEAGYFITSGEAPSQPVKAEATPETVKVPLSEHNFTQYFSVKFDTENFSNYQQNLRVGTSIVPQQHWQVDYVLTVTALTRHPYENVKFTAFNYAADYMKDTNIGGPYFSDLTMPQGGLLTKRETKNGSYLGYNYLSSSNPRILSTLPGDYGVRYVSGYMLLPYEEGMQALSTLYKRGESYMTQEKYQEAASLFKSLGDYENAKALAKAADPKQKDKAAADKAAREAEKAAADLKTYNDAVAAMENGDYAAAVTGFESLIMVTEGGSSIQYKDSEQKLAEARKKKEEADRLAAYEAALQLEKEGDYTAAEKAFAALGEYKDAAEKAQAMAAQNVWQGALVHASNGDFNTARITAEKIYDLLTEDQQQQFADWFFRKLEIMGPFNKDCTALYYYGGKYCLMDAQFNLIWGPGVIARPANQVPVFHDGLLAEGDPQTGLFGYVNTRGEWAIPCQYSSAGQFTGGHALVTKGGTDCIIDTTGSIICQLPQKKGRAYKRYLGEGLTSFTEKNLYGAVDVKGKVVIKAKYLEIAPFENGLAMVQGKKGKDTVFGVINAKGKEVVKPGKYTTKTRPVALSEDKIAIKLPNKKYFGKNSTYWSIINLKGKVLVEGTPSHGAIKRQGDYILLPWEKKWTLYDTDLNPVTVFTNTNDVQVGGSNIVAVKKDKTAGYQFYHLNNTKSPIISDYFTEVRLDPASPYLLAKHPTRGWCVYDASGNLIH